MDVRAGTAATLPLASKLLLFDHMASKGNPAADGKR
jgi:hypothetical protein